MNLMMLVMKIARLQEALLNTPYYDNCYRYIMLALDMLKSK